MVTLQKQVRGRKPRYIPDRPPGGYHVADGDSAPSTASMTPDGMLRRLDAITRAERSYSATEQRRARIADRLKDPAYVKTIPPGDRRRIEAEDLIADLEQTLLDVRWLIGQLASEIAAGGTGLPADALDAIGVTLNAHSPPLAAVTTHCPGILTHATWQRLLATACPF